jgi:16S rRNA (uracil1498-N3)-methyltransferase
MAAREAWLLAKPGDLVEGGLVNLDSTESHHAAGPLRRSPGDRVVLADGAGVVAEGVLRRVSGGGCEVEVVALRRETEPPEHELRVALSVLHGRAMDWAVQKAVEIGVGGLIPVCAERSQLRIRAASGRLGHWRRVSRQALKQCHRPWEMELAEPVVLNELVESRGEGGGLVADRTGCALHELAVETGALLLVGPEGGFSEAESMALEAAGWPRMRLGRYVLRAETAVTVGAAMLVERLRKD